MSVSNNKSVLSSPMGTNEVVIKTIWQKTKQRTTNARKESWHCFNLNLSLLLTTLNGPLTRSSNIVHFLLEKYSIPTKKKQKEQLQLRNGTRGKYYEDVYPAFDNKKKQTKAKLLYKDSSVSTLKRFFFFFL